MILEARGPELAIVKACLHFGYSGRDIRSSTVRGVRVDPLTVSDRGRLASGTHVPTPFGRFT